MIKKRVIASAIIAVFLVLPVSGNATSEITYDSKQYTVSAPIPNEIRKKLVSPSIDSYSPIPQDTRIVVDRIRSIDDNRQINGVEYLPDEKSVRIYAAGDVSYYESLIRGSDSSIPIVLIKSAYYPSELHDAIQDILYRTSNFNDHLTSIAPKTDGSGIVVAVDVPDSQSVASIDMQAQSITSIPVELNYAEKMESAIRVGDTIPYSTGTIDEQ
ncbi:MULTISPECIES: hypothetical protein [unclassified Bifidobacterium]|uniref:hypothetical protein n=1 Tax=unclassified Bifidobacterium TaxID=2608897 RepID=UPI0011265682|nr:MULTISPECIES: hypothetical protein [unclassified Bifidobacterium]